MDRVKKRLSGWQADRLSLAGRVTLVKSVTSTMAQFPMQHDRLPVSTVEELEKGQRKFIWGEKEGTRKRHVVA